MENSKTRDAAIALVTEFFGSEEKAALWFATPNPGLGGIRPDDYIEIGGAHRLLQWIQNALDDNKR